MPLVKMGDLLRKAKEGGYAVGSFSVANMEMVLGVIKALEETGSPAIIQIAEVRLNHSPLELIGPLMVAAAKNSSVPVAVHFDHGKTEEKIIRALEIGFTSVMFDGSHLPFEENAARTLRVKKLAESFVGGIKIFDRPFILSRDLRAFFDSFGLFHSTTSHVFL